MKFAKVDGEKVEATPQAKGLCRSCDSELIAKCGEIKVWHWAHKGKRFCDIWWENETEWHRAWKGHFPIDWQEFIFRAQSGEKHIADVKTDQDWILEFQHSYIKPEERRAREDFYNKLLWIVDGTRRKRDKKQFFKALEEGEFLNAKPHSRRVYIDDCTILKEWAESRVPVFFDFGEVSDGKPAPLWCLLPANSGFNAYVMAFSRKDFIELHRAGTAEAVQGFAEFFNKICGIVSDEIALRRRVQKQNQLALQAQTARPRRPRGSQQYLRARSRRRL